MAKFVCVALPPKALDKDCIVIHKPEFYAEVAACERKRPQSKTMTPNYLREMIAKIGDKYAGEDFNALISVNVSPYRGMPCSNNAEAHAVVMRALQDSYPKMFDLYVEYHIKNRPAGTKLIYFTGPFTQTTKFFEHGIDQIKEKDVPVYLGHKEKRIVGKPAITDEEANSENVV